MLIHTVRLARHDTEISGSAPSVDGFRALPAPSQGGEVYTNRGEWESGGAIKNRAEGELGSPKHKARITRYDAQG